MQTLGLFQCKALGNGDDRLWLSADVNIECWTESHMKWVLALGIPSLILWGFMIPIMLLIVLYSKKDCLEDEDTVKSYGFLLKGYRKEMFFWEIVIMYRKIALVIFTKFFTSNNLF